MQARQGKHFELLQQIIPGLRKVGVLLNPSNVAHTEPGVEKAAEEAASIGIAVVHARASAIPLFNPTRCSPPTTLAQHQLA